MSYGPLSIHFLCLGMFLVLFHCLNDVTELFGNRHIYTAGVDVVMAIS